MKFRRKSAVETEVVADDAVSEESAPSSTVDAPQDAEDLTDDVERIDLGSLLVPPPEGLELRMQVDESSQQVQSVMLAGPDGAVELRAFAAPRNGDLWDEVRPKIAADMAQRGGTATEREGRFGPELVCQITVQRPEGNAIQHSRIVGINGSRWLLRATFLGAPAREPERAGDWEDLLTSIAVRRGGNPMMSGEPLPLVLPEGARKQS